MKNCLYIFLITLLLLPVSCVLAADHVGNYAKEVKVLADQYQKVVKEVERRQEEIRRERERLKAERDNDDDDDGNDNNHNRRNRSKTLAEKRAKLQQTVNSLENSMKSLTERHAADAAVFQGMLDQTGIGGAYSVGAYGKALADAIRERGLRDDFKQEDFHLVKVYDPAQVLALLVYEINSLSACGITDLMNLPERYGKHAAFLNFYVSLDAYRQLTDKFYVVKDPSYTKQQEVKRRAKMIMQQAKNLHRIVRENNPDFAKELDLPGFAELIEQHCRQFAFRKYDNKQLDELVYGGGCSNLAITPAHKKGRERLLEITGKYFDSAAEELRETKTVKLDTGNSLKFKFDSVQKKKNRKSGKDETPDAGYKNPFTAFFAENGKHRTVAEPVYKPAQKKEPEKELQSREQTPPASGAEQQKFRSEREQFRKDYAGTSSLLANGLPIQFVSILKQTMTEQIRTLFADIAQKKMENGTPENRAYAEAFLAVRAKENAEVLSGPEIENIRQAMEQHKNPPVEQKEETSPAENISEWE